MHILIWYGTNVDIISGELVAFHGGDILNAGGFEVIFDKRQYSGYYASYIQIVGIFLRVVRDWKSKWHVVIGRRPLR